MTTPAAIDVDTAALRKARGAFWTPAPVAEYVTRWAVRSPGDRVLEPSCGEAAFLLSALAQQTKLTADGGQKLGDLAGVELHAASAKSARDLLHAAGSTAQVREGDFFAVEPSPTFDAVVGNPLTCATRTSPGSTAPRPGQPSTCWRFRIAYPRRQ